MAYNSYNSYNSKENYPRPDFVHANHRWTPLNAGWTILFDDEDVGLQQAWHINGVPEKVSVAAPTTTTTGGAAEAEAEARRLAAFPELKEKGFQDPKTRAREHTKKPINVPFVFQTPASGIDANNEAHEILWYEQRQLADPRSKAERDAGDRVLARFGAVDYDVTVWAAGYPVAQHRGGHVPFDVDLTDAWNNSEGRLDLVLRIRDSPHDLSQPRGKQYWAPQPESIFYKPSSGIWQPVWLEVVPPTRVGDSSAGTVLRSTDTVSGVLEATVAILGRRAGHAYTVEIEGFLHGLSVAKKREPLPSDKDQVAISLGLALSDEQKASAPESLVKVAPLDDAECWQGSLALWSPDHPTLYDVSIRVYDASDALLDEARTHTGFRHLDWTRGDRTFRLNGRPLFQALVLDQGYWPETGMTPPSPDSLRADIELSKQMGFNGCRKHQKVEDPVFLYWADRLGYLVWGEMANAYEFTPDYAERFEREWVEAVKRDINHPSVVTWTPVNESWAYPNLKDNVDQRNHIRSLYYTTKTLDPTRPVNDNCGWEHVLTDLSTFHDYSDAPLLSQTCATLEGILGKKLGDRDFFVGPIASPTHIIDEGTKHKEGAPVICTEFGGVNIAPAKKGNEGGGGEDRDWGYTTASDSKDLLKRFEALLRAVVGAGHCCGFVYTQLSDIEQEVNGLYSFDRREKIPAVEVKKLIEAAKKMYYDSLS